MSSITPHFTVLPSLLAISVIDISGIPQPKTTYHAEPCLKHKQGHPCCADAVLFEDLASGRVDAVGLSTGSFIGRKTGSRIFRSFQVNLGVVAVILVAWRAVIE